MLKMSVPMKRWVLVASVCIAASSITGCIESSFDLAGESRLPQGMAIPPRLTRADVSVTLDFYTLGQAKFTLRDKNGRKVTTLTGKTEGNPIYLTTTPQARPDPTGPSYEMVVLDGVTEIIECRPYREHENMEENGRVVARFYVVDDPAVKKQVLAGRGVQ